MIIIAPLLSASYMSGAIHHYYPHFTEQVTETRGATTHPKAHALTRNPTLPASCAFSHLILSINVRGEGTHTFERLWLALCILNQTCGMFHILPAAFFELQFNFVLLTFMFCLVCKLEGRYPVLQEQWFDVLSDKRDTKESWACSRMRSWLLCSPAAFDWVTRANPPCVSFPQPQLHAPCEMGSPLQHSASKLTCLKTFFCFAQPSVVTVLHSLFSQLLAILFI